MPRFSLCRLYYIVPLIVLFASFFGPPDLQEFGWLATHGVDLLKFRYSVNNQIVPIPHPPPADKNLHPTSSPSL